MAPTYPSDVDSSTASEATAQQEAVSASQVIPPPSNGEEKVSRAPYPDEENDTELADLNLPSFQDVDHKEAGAKAALAKQDLPSAIQGITTTQKDWLDRIEHLKAVKTGFLKQRVQENQGKIQGFQKELEGIAERRKVLEGDLESKQKEVFALQQAVQNESVQLLAESAGPFHAAKQKARDAAMNVTPPSAPNSFAGYSAGAQLDLLNPSASLPENPRLANIAIYRDRLLRMKGFHASTAGLVTGLRKNGISDSVSKMFLWSGYTLLAGAGGVIGALLQNADLNSHYLEEFFFSIQKRLGFVNAGAPQQLVSGAQLFGVLAISLLALVVLVMAIVGTVSLLSYFLRGKGASSEEEETDGWKRRFRPRRNAHQTDHNAEAAADAGLVGKNILNVIFKGQKPLAQLLPGLFVFMTAMLVFLALAPPFQTNQGQGNAYNSIPITKSSIGFVMGVGIATLAHFVVSFSVFPALRSKLESGESLILLQPWKAIGLYGGAVVLLVFCLALGMKLHQAEPDKGSPASTTQTAASNVSAANEGGGNKKAAISWGSTLSWSAAGLLLCLACFSLAFGNAVGGVFREESFHRGKCNEIEHTLLGQLELLAEEKAEEQEAKVVRDSSNVSVVSADPFVATQGPLSLDRSLQSLLASGLLPPERFKEFASNYSKLNVETSALHLLLAKRNLLNEERDAIKTAIYSRERSTFNYQNRIARIEQQAAALALVLGERYQRALSDYTEGYLFAQQAFYAPAPGASSGASA